MDSRILLETNLDVDDKIIYTLVQKEVNLSILHHKEYKDITKIFYINIHVKKTKVDSLFISSSQANLIEFDLVSNLRLEFHDHPIPYPLVWVNKYV